jgi:zinc transport system ATP-binding protein
MSNILEVKNLNIEFGSEKVIDNLSFNLAEKENLVVIGPNGAGKSVLLRALLGVLPYKGEIKWRENVKIGYVPQKFFIDKSLPLSIKEFFGFKKIDKEKIEGALKTVGINDFSILDKKVGVVSFGQLQRILIAWALIDKPDILLFDEPFSGIDLKGEETIYRLLKQIEKDLNLTVILITHDLSIVHEFADTVLCLNKQTICYGAPQTALDYLAIKKLYGGDVKFYHHDDNYGH